MPPREDVDYESGEKTPLIKNSTTSDISDSVNGNGTIYDDGSTVSSSKKKKIIKVTTIVILSSILIVIGIVHVVASFKGSGSSSSSSSSSLLFDDHNSPDDDATSSSSSTPSSSSLFGTSPVKEFGLFGVERSEGSDPSGIWGNIRGPYPTNSWYLNLVSHKAQQQPDDMTSAYTMPYIVDTAAAPDTMAGIRLHWPVVKTSETNVQMVDDFKNGVSFGTYNLNASYVVDGDDTSGLSHLGLSLKWGSKQNSKDERGTMTTHLVRGMPYATMVYDVPASHSGRGSSKTAAMPAFFSYNAPAGPLLVDGGATEVDCTTSSTKTTTTHTAKNEIEMHFRNSDFTWALFFSRPVSFGCEVIGDDMNVASFNLNVTDVTPSAKPLVVRLALLDECTTGKSDIQQHCTQKHKWSNQKGYVKMLKERASIFPTSPSIEFEYPNMDVNVDDDSGGDNGTVHMTIDWMANNTSSDGSGTNTTNTTGTNTTASTTTDGLIMFALPHHQQNLGTEFTTDYCVPTFLGSMCLVEGDTWSLSEDVSSPIRFVAGRPPDADIIPDIAKALKDDISYQLSDNVMRGAADTYFPGKVLARVGRVISIATELNTLASGNVDTVRAMYDDDVPDDDISASMKAASKVTLPTEDEIMKSVEMLKKAVEIWLSPKAEAIYVYDKSWGGLVNCGCKYSTKDSHGHCKNTYPECPALADVNENFGNGFYNDHHFHYGYHVYAAAVVAAHDSAWAQESFHQILLYIRDFANPAEDDQFFPPYRQKDWFLGSSWAAGIVSAENSPHGRNQESSSEAIAAYEAVALYGSTMVKVFEESDDSSDDLLRAKAVLNAGQLLTLTEVRAANRYWHVWSSDNHTNIYPSQYKRLVVGMLYETMASFETWFGPEAIFSYGIQLIPLTPIGEYRDDPVWASELYPKYVDSCTQSGKLCTDNGWQIPKAGLLATIGKRHEAVKQALEIPTEIFAHEGAVGNSLTNTIWYIATRKSFSGNSTNTTIGR